MSRFEDLSLDKNLILNKFISSQELCKSVNYNDINFLDQPNIQQPSQLIYNRIFPYLFIPDVNEEAKTFVNLSFKNYVPVNGSFKAGYIYVYVFTHKNLYRTAYGKLRTDYIIQKVDELLNGNTDISIGKLQFYKMDEYLVNANYSGNYVAYKTYDFN